MSDLDPKHEINPDDAVGVTFRELGLEPKILKALDEIGYERPTPIQARAIPSALKNRDVLGIAQTGTGKTGAFVLPTLNKLAKGRARARMPRCLIVCPTRELAAQVAENVETYGKYLKLEMALLIGGVSFAEQNKKLTKGVDVLIATPGRLLDQFERGKILMTGVQTLVVDEADRMMDMGFIPDIERIFEITPFTRQVLFFSATMPGEIKRLVDKFLHQPDTIQVARKNMTAKTVRQRMVEMPSSDHKQKRTTLRWLINNLEGTDNGIVFCNRKRDVDIVAKSLTKHGYKAAPIHGDLAQSLRTQTLDDFKTGEINWLVASDVAARGLDVPDVSYVFNYDVPTHAEDYVHRIGRTGRAGRKGDAVMLVGRLDDKYYDAILDMTKQDGIEEIEVPGIEDFAKGDGKRRGRDGRDGRKSGRGRGRDRSRGREDGARCKRPDPKPESPKVEEITAKTPSKPKATSKTTGRRRAAPARKKAPKGKTAKPETVEHGAETQTEAPRRRRAPEGRRRAAPKRKTPKPEDTQTDDVLKENGDRKRSARRKSAGPDDKPGRAPRRKSAPKPEADTPKSGPKAKSSRNGRSNSEGRKRRGNDLPPTQNEGFGESVPAFFKAI